MFAQRRAAMMSKMNGGVAVIFSGEEVVRSRDTNFPFRQDSYFSYLTGFPEPQACAVLMPGNPDHEFVLFVRDRNKERETWDGRRFGPEGAKREFGADAAFTWEELPQKLPELLENQKNLYYHMGIRKNQDAVVMAALEEVRNRVRRGIEAPTSLVDAAEILDEMRLFKSEEELELMRRAGSISTQAHVKAMQSIRPGMYEYQIEGIIAAHFRMEGSVGPAYTTIAGSGINATILHYVENKDACAAGDLLLVDAGCEYQGYAADITRTYPVSGTFTPEQRAVYEVVLDAQEKAIDRVRPGVTFDKVHEASLHALVEGLVSLKVLSGSVDGLIEQEAYKPFFMHKTGHWLGLDVHDVGSYRVNGKWRKLEPGMVTTVEPGLYFGEDAPEHLRGIGIRIEDDIVVTKDDPENLTEEVPKKVDEIEALTAEVASV